MKRMRMIALAAGLLTASGVAWGQQAILGQIHAALDAGEADRALGLLHQMPQGGASNAEADNLACRVEYTLRHWDAAASLCERAVQIDGTDSNHHLWLGRALGGKAEHASFVSAYSLGKRSREEFERAVALNPRNVEALSDLGEFYQEAPGIVGGGADKAEQIAVQLDKVDAARAHQLRGKIAEGRKDYSTAERELKAAVSASQHPALHWTTLASFFKRRQRWQDLDWALKNAYTAARTDRHATVALYDGAGVLAESKRDPETAVKMLDAYLASDTKTEEGPAFEAHLRLGKLKKLLGDRASAERERAAALALAHDYKPAQEARFE